MIPLSSEEVLSKRTRNAKHFKLGDGQYQAEISLADVHYESESNGWHDIDTTLFDEAEFDLLDFPVYKEKAASFKAKKAAVQDLKKQGKLNRDSLDYHALKVPFDAVLPRKINKGYTIGKGQDRLTFIPENASVVIGSVNANVVQYQNVWTDADVSLELTDRGIKETIILKTDKAPVEFSFEVKGPLTDELTAGELRLEPAWLQDANGEKRDVSQTVRRQNGKMFVDLSADLTGLVYPVEIDPTVTFMSTTTGDGKDTHVRSDNNFVATYPTAASVSIGEIDGSPYYWYEGLIQFDLSSIPIGSVTSNADLTVVSNGGQYYSVRDINIKPLASAWDEATVRWSNKPAVLQSPSVASTFDSNIGTYNTWDITTIVNAWTTGQIANNGIRIEVTNNPIGSIRYFYSSDYTGDGTQRPVLAVTYNAVPTAPTVIEPNGGETWNTQHAIKWNQATDGGTPTTIQTTTATTTIVQGIGMVNPVGQTFKVTRVEPITKVQLYIGAYSTAKANKVLRLMPTYLGLSNGTPYASVTIPSIGTVAGWYTLTLPTPLSFATGTILAVDISDGTGLTAYGNANGSDIYTDGAFFYGGNTDGNRDIPITVTYSEVTPQSQLQHHIQYSPDNGVSWSDIIALTNAGVSSYVYDFTSKPQTSTAKIRIRAYDGTGFGPWDESNGVFSIQHNAAPNAPTHKNISNLGSTINQRPKFFFNVSDPDAGNTITDARVQIATSSAFTTLFCDDTYSAAPARFTGIPAANNGVITFQHPSGMSAATWYIRVMSKDNAGTWSAWSATQSFVVAAAPWADVIPDDGFGFQETWLNDLATVINNARQFRGLAAATFTDGTLDNTKDIKAAHVTERRTNLKSVLDVVAVVPTWTDATLDSTVDRKGKHISELRTYCGQT